MAGAVGRLEALAGVDPNLDVLTERYRALAIEAQDLAADLHGYGEALAGEAAHPRGGTGALQAVEERLETLDRLMRKHGGETLDTVLRYAERAGARRGRLLGAAVALEQVEARQRDAQGRLDEHVLALRAAREEAAPRLAAAVKAQLEALAMPDASFEIQISPRAAGPSGGDAVELLIAPNPGVAAGPLREIASGGELSRVMLALIASADSPGGAADHGRRTLVFDEIDAGIGGHTARAVGERLRELAAGRQVLCITHLPQIASLATRHFSVAKDHGEDATRTSVLQLAESEVVSELVRMLGAADGDASARRHARELRRAA
jgi:DNA repair protein RecN (Recombination protein N)